MCVCVCARSRVCVVFKWTSACGTSMYVCACLLASTRVSLYVVLQLAFQILYHNRTLFYETVLSTRTIHVHRPSHLQIPGGPEMIRVAIRSRAIEGPFAVM